MWHPRSPQARPYAPASNTTWQARTVNQAASGSPAACPATPARWPSRQRYSGRYALIAKKQSGPSVCLCCHQTAVKLLKSGERSPSHFLKKWASTLASTRGLHTAIHIKTTISTSASAGSQAMARFGIKSIQHGERSKHVPNWRLNLN